MRQCYNTPLGSMYPYHIFEFDHAGQQLDTAYYAFGYRWARHTARHCISQHNYCCKAELRRDDGQFSEAFTRQHPLTLDELLLRKARAPRPLIYCLCGSTTRAAAEFTSENLRLTLAGHIVLSIGVSMSDNDLGISPAMKDQLDILHLHKIDLADIVRILNVEGYVGTSTRRELEYALLLEKPVEFLEPPSEEIQALIERSK